MKVEELNFSTPFRCIQLMSYYFNKFNWLIGKLIRTNADLLLIASVSEGFFGFGSQQARISLIYLRNA